MENYTNVNDRFKKSVPNLNCLMYHILYHIFKIIKNFELPDVSYSVSDI